MSLMERWEKGDRVIVQPYRSWTDEDQEYMVSDEKNLIGTLDAMMPISTINTPGGEVPAPGTDYHCWVVLDNPIGIQAVIQCKMSQLRKGEG